MDARVFALERKCHFLELEQYKFHGYESTRLQKENANDAKVLVKFIQCLFARFDARHSVISDRRTNFQSVFERISHFIGTSNRLIIAYHPYACGKEEVTNCGFKWVLSKTIDQFLKDSLIQIQVDLWAFRISFKKPIDRHLTVQTSLWHGLSFTSQVGA